MTKDEKTYITWYEGRTFTIKSDSQKKVYTLEVSRYIKPKNIRLSPRPTPAIVSVTYFGASLSGPRIEHNLYYVDNVLRLIKKGTWILND